jgi:hypothetical protein
MSGSFSGRRQEHSGTQGGINSSSFFGFHQPLIDVDRCLRTRTGIDGAIRVFPPRGRQRLYLNWLRGRLGLVSCEFSCGVAHMVRLARGRFSVYVGKHGLRMRKWSANLLDNERVPQQYEPQQSPYSFSNRSASAFTSKR